MLEPDQRALLLDAFKPPSGMVVDRAIGTTFSLDLEALLLAPVAFALFEARLAEDGATTDPLTLLEAVRRHADRIDVFCQAGQISLPSQYQPILSYLEDSIHPAAAPSPHHIFHPKVWLLRFTAPSGGEAAYRLLVLSRNLTFNRSWDTMVQLEGSPSKRTLALTAVNRPLADFLTALPTLAVRALPDRTVAINNVADEIRSVVWEPPDRMQNPTFHPSGIGRYTTALPDEPLRLLVMAPFLSRKTVARLSELGERNILISRPESLDRIPGEILDSFERVYQMADGASDLTEEPDTPPDEGTAERPGVPLAGLHAKLLVAERGGKSVLRSGSTNATDAGWGGNVEFMVELTGRKYFCGIDAILGDNDKGTSLRHLLAEYHRTDPDSIEPTDAERVALTLEVVGRELTRLSVTASVEADDELYRMVVTADRPLPTRPDLAIRCWPITLKADATAVDQTIGQPLQATFRALSLTALTSFIAFELQAPSEDGMITTRVVTNARLIGAPEDRKQRVLTAQLRNRTDVLRYLLLLLVDIGDHTAYEFATLLVKSGTGEASEAHMTQIPLFESMVRALSRNPSALDHVARLIDDLAATDEGQALLPEGLDRIWGPIWQARQESRS